MMYGDYQPKTTDQYKVPEITADAAHPTAWVRQNARQPLTFQAAGQSQPFELVPLYKVIRERYAIYWRVGNKNT